MHLFLFKSSKKEYFFILTSNTSSFVLATILWKYHNANGIDSNTYIIPNDCKKIFKSCDISTQQDATALKQTKQNIKNIANAT